MICENKRQLAKALMRCAHRSACLGCPYLEYERERERNEESWKAMCVDVLMEEASLLLDPPHRPANAEIAKVDYYERIKAWEKEHGKEE